MQVPECFYVGSGCTFTPQTFISNFLKISRHDMTVGNSYAVEMKYKVDNGEQEHLFQENVNYYGAMTTLYTDGTNTIKIRFEKPQMSSLIGKYTSFGYEATVSRNIKISIISLKIDGVEYKYRENLP